MKINLFLTIISILLASLIGYLAYNIAESKENDIICGIGTCLCVLVTLVPTISMQYESGRLGTNIRVFSIINLVLFLISNFCFAGFGINIPYYIIVNGVLLVIYLAVLYKMQNVDSI